MVYYLVRLQHHHITEEFGTLSSDDPYDHYIGDTDERTNLRFIVVNDGGLEQLTDQFIPEDPFDYESVAVLCEFYYEHDMRRFIQCMQKVKINGDVNGN